MKKILRLYVWVDGKEVCIKDPIKIIETLNNLSTDVDLDYSVGEHVKIGSTRELIGETVMVGNEDFVYETVTIANH